MRATTTRPSNIVFVVCHPDDEALWVGGILCELPRFNGIRTYVICLSGRDPASPREREFEAARRVAGYHAGIVLGSPIRPAAQPLPPVHVTVANGLSQLSLSLSLVDLLITHSPYGDEHRHPHHCQAYRELRTWTHERDIPFGFFSCLPISDFAHIPIDAGFRRAGSLHLLNRSRCEWPFGAARRDVECPAEYVQFSADPERKRTMLNCYRSIDLVQHEAGYAAFTSNCESFYVSDRKGSAVIDAIMGEMPTPGPDDLMARHPFLAAPPSLARRLARKLRAVVSS